MTIGIPRSLFYYRYSTLIKTFFNELDIDYIISDPSNKKTLEDGIKLAPSEACISLKLFLGHIKNLEDRCDYILVPRIASIKKDEKVCTNFYLLYDLVSNLFTKNILDINIDETNCKHEKSAFIELGLYLGFSFNKVSSAYKKAKEKVRKIKNKQMTKQLALLNDNKKKVLLVGHSYNIYDEFIGKPIIDILKNNNIEIIDANIFDEKEVDKYSNMISNDNYFTLNKELMSGTEKYKDNVDGIILISCFPCGPDSICNELIQRGIKSKPIINLIIDEETGPVGLITRLESFIDIINKETSYE